jgi:hypothetical protein
MADNFTTVLVISIATTAIIFIWGKEILVIIKGVLTLFSIKPDTFEYECPKCHNGNILAETYGSYDQFESGACMTCEYKYDGFTEDYIQ